MNNISLHGHVAVLIDADNIQLSYLKQVLEISEYYGQLKICRIYGDWNAVPLSAWRDKVDTFNIERIQVDRIGKNATDHRLLIEAGEITGQGNSLWEEDSRIDVFIIVSGDGDYASSYKMLRERGKQVISIGNLRTTSSKLQEVASESYFLENLDHKLISFKERYPISPNEVREFHRRLIFAYARLNNPEHKHDLDWVPYSQIDARLREDIDFQVKYTRYGLSEWLRSVEQDFETREQEVRKIDHNPEWTLYTFLINAYLEVKQKSETVSLAQLGKALHELDIDYEARFSSKKLSRWLEDYPDKFKISAGYVTEIRDHTV